MESILVHWWQFLIILAGACVAVWAVVFAVLHFLVGAKKAGVDEVSAGIVKIDFEDEK